VYADSQESDVLGRARAGDERAFLALYRAAQPGLLRYLTLLVGDAAEEVAAQTWIEVGRELATFAGTLDGFRGWVAGLGRRRALDYQGSETALPTLAQEPVGGPTPPRTTRALGIIAELPRDEAETVALRSVMGLDEAETATVLGVRRGTVRRTALRGLRALARRLDPVMETGRTLEGATASGSGGAAGSARVTGSRPLPQPSGLELSTTPIMRNLRVVPGGGAAQSLPQVTRYDLGSSQGIEVSR
jgi:RNA polymerase sigma-70 factor (ECF subfamily)